MCWECVTLLYTERLRGRKREFIILERLWALARERDLQIGHTCFLLTSASLQYLHKQLMMNRADQRTSWLVKQVASRLRQRWRRGKKCLFGTDWIYYVCRKFWQRCSTSATVYINASKDMRLWRQMLILSWYFISNINIRLYNEPVPH